jgi:hypothetical protein
MWKAIKPYNYITSRFVFELSDAAQRARPSPRSSACARPKAPMTRLSTRRAAPSSARARRSDWRRLWYHPATLLVHGGLGFEVRFVLPYLICANLTSRYMRTDDD